MSFRSLSEEKLLLPVSSSPPLSVIRLSFLLLFPSLFSFHPSSTSFIRSFFFCSLFTDLSAFSPSSSLFSFFLISFISLFSPHVSLLQDIVLVYWWFPMSHKGTSLLRLKTCGSGLFYEQNDKAEGLQSKTKTVCTFFYAFPSASAIYYANKPFGHGRLATLTYHTRSARPELR